MLDRVGLKPIVYPELVAPPRIEREIAGYQPTVIPFNYRGIIWWSLMESNHLPTAPLNNGYRVTAGNGEQAPNLSHTL